MLKKKSIMIFLVFFILVSQIPIHSQSIDVDQAESSTDQITFYFKDYFNRENETLNDSFGSFRLVSVNPPTSSQNKFYPVLFFNGLRNQQDALMDWLTTYCYELAFEDLPEEFEDILEALKIMFPHYLNIVEAYEHISEESIQIDGDVQFTLYFKSRFGFNKFHNDYVKVSLYKLNPNGFLPIKIANQTVKIQQNMLYRINDQKVFLENIDCRIDPETLLLFSVEIIPTNRSITTRIADSRTILHKTIVKCIMLIRNSDNPQIKEFFDLFEEFQSMYSEYNLSSDDYAKLMDAIIGPSFVYDSKYHPSSVIVPIRPN